MTTVKEWWNENFAQDIHSHLRQQERKRFLYRGYSPQLHLRKRTVKYIHTICEQLEFCTTALHLAVYLMDIFMDNHTIQSKHLQMASLVCLIVAVKVEEQISLVPRNSDFNLILGNKYKLSEFVEMEVTVLSFFRWDVLIPTAAHFAEYYSLYSLRQTDSHDNKPLSSFKLVKVYVLKYINYFLEVSLQDPAYLNYSPSLVAAACVASSRMSLVITPPWPPVLQTVTCYRYSQLKSCVDLLLKALDADILASRRSSQHTCSENSCSKCEKKAVTETPEMVAT
ncbi:hypothetical protein JTE90_025315 [Oedothorax gibbosus]|uniref:Cyclin-J n=1 Tax=Oedothorax gibbosus TaxID=931172 RepID=A0AAV6V651_9ARAC|nr:hypothetical protein JTE90_025315 [Oedothorax gibbosus]